jgi:hypothetical protein
MICAESTHRIDGLSVATRGALSPYSLELGLDALQDMHILCVPQDGKRDSVHFWRRAMVHGWKMFLPLNRARVESARTAAASILKSKAYEGARMQNALDQLAVAEAQLQAVHKSISDAEAARKQQSFGMETALKEADKALKQADAALKQVDVARKQQEAAHSKTLADIKTDHKLQFAGIEAAHQMRLFALQQQHEAEKKRQLEIQSTRDATAEILAEIELAKAKAEKAAKNV